MRVRILARLVDIEGLRAIAGEEMGVAIDKLGAMRPPRSFDRQGAGA